VVSGSGQFMCHRLGRYDLIGLGRLALVEALDTRVVAHSEVGGLYEGTRQVFVAALAVASPFFLSLDMRLACTQRA